MKICHASGSFLLKARKDEPEVHAFLSSLLGEHLISFFNERNVLKPSKKILIFVNSGPRYIGTTLTAVTCYFSKAFLDA